MNSDHDAIEPLRLLDDEAESTSLRDALAREKAFRANYDDAQGLARFQATLGAQISKDGIGDAAPAGAFRRFGSLVSLLGLGIVLTVVVLGPRWATPKPVASAPIAATEIAPRTEAQPPKAAPEVPSLSVEALPAAPSPEPSKPSARTAPVPAAKPSAPGETSFDPLEETRHLGALRRIAPSDPARALAMIEEGNRRFAKGSFREERDAIAVSALAGLGRESEARRTGQTFLATYPTSPLSPQVRRAAGL